jgi:class 3 adenylate cyclase/tetratricopeptide (TPR) repeat protein
MPASDERKLVTVLFADIVGSSELAARHDPEPFRAMLSAFFDEMRQQIESYGGTVEKYAGDAIMAVFGVPTVHEDDAERAVRAAVAMRDALAQLNPMFEQEYGTRLSIRIGIATGDVVAASQPVREFMVTGEVPNLAARLQSIADPIALSDSTRALLGALVDAEPAGPVDLKGFPGVRVWQLRGLQAAESRRRGVPGLTSPLVGRDREMTALAACVEELRRGRGQVVFLVGEAGLGKSRIKVELRDGLGPDVRWLEGRCQSYTQTTGYAAIVEILRAGLGLGGAASPAIARTKLRLALRSLAGEGGDALLPALAHLLDVDLGPQAPAPPADPRAQLVVASRAVFENLARRQPVVLAIEDLHWADTATIELLTVLTEMTDLHPVMILVTMRPDTEGDAWTFRLHVERNYGHRLTDLRLRPLAADDGERLTDNLLRVADLPEDIRRVILDRAEGNPFFLEEVVRTLIEQGVLRRDGERWVVAGAVSGSAVPPTVRGVLAARIDRLPAAAKTVLHHASVIGRYFEYDALRALGGDGAELDRALAHLLRAELIREWSRLPERRYLFKHALTHDAAYESVLESQRAALHAKVAEHLAAASADKAAEPAVLAHHWDRAGKPEHALHYTLQAAARADSLYARPEAIRHYWRALDLLPTLSVTHERRRTFVAAVLALVQLPGFAKNESERQRVLGLLEEARRAAEELGDPDSTARAEASLGLFTNDEARIARAHGQARGPLARAIVAHRHHLYLGFVGRYDDALVQVRRAIELYAAAGARVEEATSVNGGGRCWAARAGRLEESLAFAARFRRLASELDDVSLLALRAMEAEPYVYLGWWQDAVRVAEESLPIAFRIAESTSAMFPSAWLGFAYLKLGRSDDARQVLDRALRWGETRIGLRAFATAYLTMVRAFAYLTEGDHAQATDWARRALRLAEEGRYTLERGASHRVLGQALEMSGQRADAEMAFRQSLEILGGIQSLSELGQTLLAYGRFRLADDRDDGRRLIERAAAIFEEIGATGWLAETSAALA